MAGCSTDIPLGNPNVRLSSGITLPEDTKSRSSKSWTLVLPMRSIWRPRWRQAHWNVKGIHFFQLHELFDIAGHLEERSDLIA